MHLDVHAIMDIKRTVFVTFKPCSVSETCPGRREFERATGDANGDADNSSKPDQHTVKELGMSLQTLGFVEQRMRERTLYT